MPHGAVVLSVANRLGDRGAILEARLLKGGNDDVRRVISILRVRAHRLGELRRIIVGRELRKLGVAFLLDDARNGPVGRGACYLDELRIVETVAADHGLLHAKLGHLTPDEASLGHDTAKIDRIRRAGLNLRQNRAKVRCSDRRRFGRHDRAAGLCEELVEGLHVGEAVIGCVRDDGDLLPNLRGGPLGERRVGVGQRGNHARHHRVALFGDLGADRAPDDKRDVGAAEHRDRGQSDAAVPVPGRSHDLRVVGQF